MTGLEKKMETGSWTSWVESLKRNGVFAIRSIDDLLEPSAMPVHLIVVRGGVVKKQIPIHSGGFYIHLIPDMEGWVVDDVLQWVNNNEVSSGAPRNNENQIMFIN